MELIRTRVPSHLIGVGWIRNVVAGEEVRASEGEGEGEGFARGYDYFCHGTCWIL